MRNNRRTKILGVFLCKYMHTNSRETKNHKTGKMHICYEVSRSTLLNQTKSPTNLVFCLNRNDNSSLKDVVHLPDPPEFYRSYIKKAGKISSTGKSFHIYSNTINSCKIKAVSRHLKTTPEKQHLNAPRASWSLLRQPASCRMAMEQPREFM